MGQSGVQGMPEGKNKFQTA